MIKLAVVLGYIGGGISAGRERRARANYWTLSAFYLIVSRERLIGLVGFLPDCLTDCPN